MKLKTSTYELRLTFEAPVHIPQDILEKVLDNSTALDALEEGVWNWLPLPDEALESTDSVFEMRVSVVKGRYDDETEDE